MSNLENNTTGLQELLSMANNLPDAPEVPNCKIYEVTHVQGYGNVWNLLVTLDDEVLAHINDASFSVLFVLDQPLTFEYYSGTMYTASNRSIGTQYDEKLPLYGYSNRLQTESMISLGFIYHPANQTGSECIGGYGAFRVSDGKYYLKPSDGYIHSGKYRLIFTW